MDENKLMELTIRKLFKKFGKGNHEPGSGSAAAFQGMLSSHLTVTVISLTLDSARIKYYLESKKQLNNYKKRLEHYIIPRLEELFEEDSIQFDKVIQLRNLRDKTVESVQKHNYEQKHLKQLKVATEIPIEIAELCIEVSEIASFVFTNGFQAARGDTCVAQSNSIAAVQGCISIIDLNLISFMPDSWTKEKMNKIDGLTKSYFILNQSSHDNFFKLQTERSKRHLLQEEISGLVKKIKTIKTIKDNEIENLTSEIQNLVWKNKSYLWRKPPDNPLDMLKPSVIFKKLLGYQYCDEDYVVSKKDNKRVAEGVIDQPNKVVYISKSFKREERNFTAAHELGHAILHSQAIIHRDRPLDGSRNINPKDPLEYQADKLATYFLMPRKLVVKEFKGWFGVSKFTLNEDNCFLHFNLSPSQLRKEVKTPRGLSLKIASLEKQYNGRYVSISNLFKVSKTAMARRLEELDLVEF